MKPWTAIAIVALLIASACASAPGIDRPVALDPAYAAREIGASKPSDRCGPEFISDNLPAAFVSLMGPLIDGPFRPVCARHDACYELREQTQAWCDTRMRIEMADICKASRLQGSISGALCRYRAGLYFGMVDNAYGAYSYHGKAGGEISALELTQMPQGELEICVTASNATPLLQEYAVELRDAEGRRFARAPRVKTRALRSGETAVMCAGTAASPYWNAGRLKGPVDVRLMAGDPDSLALDNDMQVIDRRRVELPAPVEN